MTYDPSARMIQSKRREQLGRSPTALGASDKTSFVGASDQSPDERKYFFYYQ